MSIRSPHDQTGDETLEFFIEDTRYGVPSMHLLKCSDGGVAAMAERLLRQSPHRRSVEVRRRGEIIYQARRFPVAPDATDKLGPA